MPDDMQTIAMSKPVAAPPAEVAVMGANPDAAVPFVFGRRIAKGGMGAILEGDDRKLGRKIAVKVMLDPNASAEHAQRFVQEAAVLGRLAHPNIVPIHDLGRDGEGALYYTMKLVKGRTLQHILDELRRQHPEDLQHYTLDRLLTIFRKVCDAMAFSHSQGIIHRDLKPENIMVGEFGEVLVMDWGISKVLGEVETPSIEPRQPPSMSGTSSFTATMDGAVMGTPNYMSPEQALGKINELDERSDIFSLGGILYAILTLRPPVEGKDLSEVLAKVQAANITSPTEFGATIGKGKPRAKGEVLEAKKVTPLPHMPVGKVPPALSAVAMKALTLDKAKRYQNVAAFSADIEKYQGGFATSAEQAGSWKQFTLFVKRHKAVSIATVVLLLVLSAFVTNVIRSEQRMAATLDDLRRTAPVFFAQAKIVLEEGDLEDALKKIGYAIQLDDANADYHLFRANLRESAQDLTAAAEGYRRVLALRPADAAAQTNLALCEKLLRESGGAALKLDQQRQLLAALRAQKRLLESAPLAALIDPNTATAKAALISRLREWAKAPGWSSQQRVTSLPDGTFKVDLNGLAPGDFSVLKGQPVSGLCLRYTGITDLSGLAGLPLKELELQQVKVTDLSPLRGMPLERLDLSGTAMTDLSPLRGMKLQALIMSKTGVSDLRPLAGMPLTLLDCRDCSKLMDLSPLRGMPLVELNVGGTSVVNLAPLAGAPLKKLSVQFTKVSDFTPLSQMASLEELNFESTSITDLTPLTKLHLTWLNCNYTKITSIAPLSGQPLRFLGLRQAGVTDLSPLADCATLDKLILPDAFGDLSLLRKLPKLRLISTRHVGAAYNPDPAQTVAEFWKEYDTQQAAKK